MATYHELIERLRAEGIPEADIERASREGRLPAFAVEVALGGAPRHTLTAVARESGLSRDFVRDLMQASGRPNPAPRERAYTDEDLDAARLVRSFLDAGLPREGVLEVARVMNHGMSQAAEAIRRLAGDALLQPGDTEHGAALKFAGAADELGPLVGELLDSQFRAHLRDGISRELVTETEREEGRLAGELDVVIAFADLVGFTRLGEQLPPEDLGRIAGRLNELSVAAASRPVRLVKTIGDGAMFQSASAPEMIGSLAALVRALRAEGEDFPDVRVGVAFGPATTRAGDWFGRTVNLAARLTGAAKPGTLLATEEIRDLAPDLPWKKKRRRGLKGVDGRVRPYELDAVALGGGDGE